MASAEEATGIYRWLADENPAAYLPNLATALSNLGVRLSELGRRREALVPAEEAVTIRRRLAEENPAAYLPGVLDGLGRTDEAADLRQQLDETTSRDAAE